MRKKYTHTTDNGQFISHPTHRAKVGECPIGLQVQLTPISTTEPFIPTHEISGREREGIRLYTVLLDLKTGKESLHGYCQPCWYRIPEIRNNHGRVWKHKIRESIDLRGTACTAMLAKREKMI